MTKNQKILFFSALLLLLVIYSNTLNVPFYFDDIEAINNSLKIEKFTPKNLYNVSFKVYTRHRPVSNLTLAFNYNLSQDPLFFHVVNLSIHILCFLFVFFFIKELFKLPKIPQKYKENAISIALAASTIWAVHPILIQGVTYTIQRMTSLCTLFYFIALYFFLKARSGRKLFYLFFGFFFLLALGSKEIAATLPLMILLIEWMFFKTEKKKLLVYILVVVILFLALSFMFIEPLLNHTIQAIKSGGYANRDYSISERLLTQSRVFMRYISLTLFPYYDRYMLDYGFLPSRSLISPLSTLFSVGFVLLTFIAGFIWRKRNAVFAFCIFSFWLGHAIEGSILNLEMIFEQRMYLPSVFLILPLTAAAVVFLQRSQLKKKYTLIFTCTIILYLGLNTYLRNDIWRDKARFLAHNVKKTPKNYRPIHNLGTIYAQRQEYDRALENYLKALSLKFHNNYTLFGIGQIYYNKKEYENAIPFYTRAIEMKLKRYQVYKNLSLSYLKVKQYEESIKTAIEGLQSYQKSPILLIRLGSLYYFIVQEMGDQGRELLAKYNIDETKAFEFLETAYLFGSTEKDLYINLPPAYFVKAEKETDTKKQAEFRNTAKKILIEGLEKFPDDPDIANNLVAINILLGNWGEVLKIKENWKDIPVAEFLTKKHLNELAVYFLNEQRFDEALEVLDFIQSKHGMDQILEFNMAICFYFLGNEDDAVKTFKKIYETTTDPSIRSQADFFIKKWEKKREIK